tara:strand:+ start:1945 stop:2049 length:105 start_codon:yes stop_codon:yes gene_type:complete
MPIIIIIIREIIIREKVLQFSDFFVDLNNNSRDD